MIQKITQNNYNFWTVNLIMPAKNCYPVVRFSGTPYRLVPSQKSTGYYSWGTTIENRSKIGDFAQTRSLLFKISGTRGRPHQ